MERTAWGAVTSPSPRYEGLVVQEVYNIIRICSSCNMHQLDTGTLVMIEVEGHSLQ